MKSKGSNPFAAAPLPPNNSRGAPASRLVSGRISIGIDPGLTGALAFIPHDMPESPWVVDMPVIAHGNGFVKRAVDLPVLAVSLKLLMVIGEPYATMESVHAFPGQGSSSMFSLGMSFWGVAGVLAALGIPLRLVEPREWKGAYALDKDKQKSIELARRLFPSVALTRKKDHGRAEALLIAEYGRRK